MRPPERRLAARLSIWILASVLAACGAYGMAKHARAQALPAGSDEPPAQDPLLRDAMQRYELRLRSGWVPMSLAAGTKVPLCGYEHPRSRALLAISRMDYPNAPAWKRKSRDAYLAEIERGLRGAAPGYERLDLEVHMLGSVPALDVSFRRTGGRGREVVLFRILLFRQYSLALALSMPEDSYRAYRTAHREVRKSFQPYFLEE